jgi:hypothetical protein
VNKLFISLIALLTLAMGGKRPDIPEPGVPSPAEPYHAKFRELANTYGAVLVGKSVVFSFRSFFGSTIGMCRMNGSGRNSVELSSSAWSKGSDTFKEMLVFHELGHCLLGRGHKNSRHSDGRPESVMNSFIFDGRTYTANRDQYLKELFTAEAMHAVSRSFAAKNHEGCSFGRQ